MLIFDLILWTIFGVVLSKIGINKYIPAIIVVIAVFLGISYLFPVEDEYQKLYGFPQAFYRIYKDTGLPEGFVSFFIFYFILDLIAWMFVGIILGKTISFFRRK
jgi:MFS superfamily sulfate permease-like transporter